MTRIIGGEFGGRTLEVPANGTRPTSDRVREAIFSKLMHDGLLDDAQVLDIFSGSGAFGLEAVSRGARSALLVDSAKKAATVAQRNVDSLGVSSQVRVVTDDAIRYTAAMSRSGGLTGQNLRLVDGQTKRAITLIFLDPPYDYSETKLTEVLENLMRTGLMLKGAGVVIERGSRTPAPTLPAGYELTDTKVYGETKVYYATVTDGPEI